MVGAPNGRGPRFLEPAEPPIATPLLPHDIYGIILVGLAVRSYSITNNDC